MSDVKTHACYICHEPTDCPDMCARCARLRSQPSDWTDHPQTPLIDAAAAVWETVMAALRRCGNDGRHSDYLAGIVNGTTRAFAAVAGISLQEATRRVTIATAFGAHRKPARA